ncbi:MAG: hypothetical protein AABY00_04215 [Nanoarchaeota archaeon]
MISRQPVPGTNIHVCYSAISPEKVYDSRALLSDLDRLPEKIWDSTENEEGYFPFVALWEILFESECEGPVGHSYLERFL